MEEEGFRWRRLLHFNTFFVSETEECVKRYEAFMRVALEARRIKGIKQIIYKDKYRCIEFYAYSMNSIADLIKEFNKEDKLVFIN